MLFLIAADIIVFLHFLWILFLLIGAWWGRRHQWVRRIHITGLSFALLIQFFGWYCPLTYLEVWLRQMDGSSGGYAGSFIIHYAEKFVYPDISAEAILTMTIVLVLISALLYLSGQNGSKHKKTTHYK